VKTDDKANGKAAAVVAATRAMPDQKASRRRWQGITDSCSTGMPTNNERSSVPMTERDQRIRYVDSLLQREQRTFVPIISG
jgi:hypothetical protein